MRVRPITAVCALALLSATVAHAGPVARGQASPGQPSPAQAGASAPAGVAAQVARLGDFDYQIRSSAAQAVRRAPATEAGPALVAAITTSPDSYVRFKAFVLLTGLLDPRLEDFARASLTDKNDRLRQAAFEWLARHPVKALAPRLVQLLETEQGEFVRPSLLRALVALDADPAVRTALVRETGRGLDLFRGALLEALGERKAAYAVDALISVLALDGPLRDVAAMALGRIGGAQAAAALAAVHDKDPSVELTLRAAQCLAEGACDAVRDRIVAQWPQSAATGTAGASADALAMLAERGDDAALAALVEAGVAGVRDLQDRAAVSLGAFALRVPERLVAWTTAHAERRDGVVRLLRDGFDLIEEDVAEEAFYATVRATYWNAAEASPQRATAAALIDGLDF